MEWAHWRNFYKKQPLWLIKRYFGDKVIFEFDVNFQFKNYPIHYLHQIGLYFAWLGFYNQMLIFPAFFGLFVFLFGAVTVNNRSINYFGWGG